jgi:UDP-N-acetylglucosamine transferase subunit ALG13
MIFVTVGAQMPFDRLVRAVDKWALLRRRDDVFAQIGPTELKTNHISVTRFIDPQEFRRRVSDANIIVAHAGMGSIITALELGKPIIVMPRRGDLMETRNDHQLATAKQFQQSGRIAVAMDEQELMERLDTLDAISGGDPIAPQASAQLIAAVRGFLTMQANGLT